MKRTGGPTAFRREAPLVLAAIRCPALVQAQEEPFLSLRLTDPGLDRLLHAMLAALFADPGLDSEGLAAHLQKTPEAGTLQRILTDETLLILKFLKPGAELNDVERGWNDALRRHLHVTEARSEVAETAAQSFADGADRWKAAVRAREALAVSDPQKGPDEDGEASAGDLADRLEKMRASVTARKRDR